MPKFNKDVGTRELCQTFFVTMDHCLNFLPNSEVEKIRGVPRRGRYGSVSALQNPYQPLRLRRV